MTMLLCMAATPAFAAAPQSSFSIRFENDAFGGTDANYTNGAALALTRAGKGLLGGIWDIGGSVGGKRYATYELAQLQFTPSDLSRTNPDPADRPYAGLLYAGCTTHLQRDDSFHSLKLIAGVAGPASLAEAAQRFTHRVFGYNVPHGWSSQIKNEPVANLVYEYRHRYHLTPRDGAFSVELIPLAGGFLGNYLIQAEAGAQFRIGYHPDDFGATVLRGIGFLPFPQEEGAHHNWGFYAYAGGTANLVGRNLTLDGNTFTQSRSVEKRLFLPATEFGASLWTQWFQATFSYVMWGREFYGQPEREDYGSVLLSFFFR